jgi:hypothetical protein
VGKSLSCRVWDECPTESSADGDRASRSTRSSIFGGQSVSSITTPQVEPSDPKQQPVPGTPESPSQLPGSEETPDPQAPDQRWSPSGVPKDQEREENQKQVPPGDSKDQQPAPVRLVQPFLGDDWSFALVDGLYKGSFIQYGR